ncbi:MULTISPECIES: DUF4190 domain-containing protein [unclassified Micromonospora]|uniref:DUF4190 domain-containing protein n=1 Tax=unclassified Micromonospora TaxID=2617518 RepID=UPI0022B6A542|nr:MULTISPECIES: DUF4190 domain-containing protein [unclassified Micromonospora]MCZ7421041.1 DUF4190 domain-containing protein [Verrucosispora sp. WMMA2121]WBB94298.1 DUF4190 domain-containing protein [Verrucosispora sp. WMMC514]
MTQPPPAGGWPDPASTGQPSSPPADPTLPVSSQPAVPPQPSGYDPYQPPADPYAGMKSDPAAAPYPPAGYPPAQPAGYPPPPPPGYGYPQPGYGYPQQKTNSLAIVALVLSLIGIGSCITAPVGAIMGHVAMRQIRETGESGEGMAKAAIIVGWILTGLLALVIIGYAIAIAFAIANSSSTT